MGTMSPRCRHMWGMAMLAIIGLLRLELGLVGSPQTPRKGSHQPQVHDLERASAPRPLQGENQDSMDGEHALVLPLPPAQGPGAALTQQHGAGHRSPPSPHSHPSSPGWSVKLYILVNILIKTFRQHLMAGLTSAGSQPGCQSGVGMAFCIPNTMQIAMEAELCAHYLLRLRCAGAQWKTEPSVFVQDMTTRTAKRGHFITRASVPVKCVKYLERAAAQ